MASEPASGNEQNLLEIGHEKIPSSLQDFVAFATEQPPQRAKAAGIFFVELAAGLQCAPVGRDAFVPLRRGFLRGMRSDPRENAGGDWAADVHAMFTGK